MNKTELKQNFIELNKKAFVIHIMALLALSLLMLVANGILKERSAKQVVSLIKYMVVENQMRDVVHTLSMAELLDFSGVIYFSGTGARIFSLPADLSEDQIKNETPKYNFTHNYFDIPIYFGDNSGTKLALIRFIYLRFSLLPYAIGLWVVALLLTIPIIQIARRRLVIQAENDLIAKTNSVKAEIAAKVRHNIRSPVLALKTALTNPSSPFDRELTSQAVKRIEEMILELETDPTQGSSPNGKNIEPIDICLLTKRIIDEKRTLLSGKQSDITLTFNFSENKIFSTVDEAEFKSSLSNLIDNAIEATQGIGEVKVKVYRRDEFVVIEVRDDGIGIEEEDQDHIFDKGFTKGKKDGTGHGLLYVKEFVDESRGFIDFESHFGKGSVFSIHIPLVKNPIKRPKEINVLADSDVVVLDDQESIHTVWKLKFSRLSGKKIRLHFFKNPDEMIKWHSKTTLKNPLYLIDYDLGKDAVTGTEVINSLKISKSSILVTGHTDDADLQEKCRLTDCSLLSKDYVSATPIVVNQN